MKQRLTAKDKKDLKLMTQAMERDSEWELVRKGSHDADDHSHFKKVRCRVVKRALETIFPNHKISVRQNTGTAHNWIQVRIILSRKPLRKPNGNIFSDQTFEVKHRVSRLLDQLPVAYSTYLTDFGGDNDYYAPCVGIHCQAFELK